MKPILERAMSDMMDALRYSAMAEGTNVWFKNMKYEAYYDELDDMWCICAMYEWNGIEERDWYCKDGVFRNHVFDDEIVYFPTKEEAQFVMEGLTL